MIFNNRPVARGRSPAWWLPISIGMLVLTSTVSAQDPDCPVGQECDYLTQTLFGFVHVRAVLGFVDHENNTVFARAGDTGRIEVSASMPERGDPKGAQIEGLNVSGIKWTNDTRRSFSLEPSAQPHFETLPFVVVNGTPPGRIELPLKVSIGNTSEIATFNVTIIGGPYTVPMPSPGTTAVIVGMTAIVLSGVRHPRWTGSNTARPEAPSERLHSRRRAPRPARPPRHGAP